MIRNKQNKPLTNKESRILFLTSPESFYLRMLAPFQQKLLIENVIYHIIDLFRDLIERIPDEKIGIVGKRAKFCPPAV
jgi:hypothetical protein